jgi:hypothetical protein
MTARITCSIAPGEDTYPLDALCETLDAVGIETVVQDDTSGLPVGYRGIGLMVSREELGKILYELGDKHDLANLADSYALLDCDDDAREEITPVEEILFYEIEMEG